MPSGHYFSSLCPDVSRDNHVLESGVNIIDIIPWSHADEKIWKNKNDKINIDQFRKKIVKTYIIGNHTNFFIKKIRKKIKFEVTKNLKVTVNKIFKFLKKKQKLTILFSPASASYDQFKNFVERGEKFKNLVKYNAKKFY